MVKPIPWYTLEIAALCQRSHAVPVILGLNTEFSVAMKNAMTLIVTKDNHPAGRVGQSKGRSLRKAGKLHSLRIVL